MGTKETRDLLGISKSQIALIFDMSKATVSAVERGSRASIPKHAKQVDLTITQHLIKLGLPLKDERKRIHEHLNYKTLEKLNRQIRSAYLGLEVAQLRYQKVLEKYNADLTEYQGLEILAQMPWPDDSHQRLSSQFLLLKKRGILAEKGFQKLIKTRLSMVWCEQELNTLIYFKNEFYGTDNQSGV